MNSTSRFFGTMRVRGKVDDGEVVAAKRRLLLVVSPGGDAVEVCTFTPADFKSSKACDRAFLVAAAPVDRPQVADDVEHGVHVLFVVDLPLPS